MLKSISPLLVGLALAAVLFSSACSPQTGSAARITSIPDSDLATRTQIAGTEVASVNPAEATVITAPTVMTEPTLDVSDPFAVMLATQNSQPATPTPLANNLEAGVAMQIAAATDVVMKPDADFEPVDLQGAGESEARPAVLKFDQFYVGYDLRRGLLLSPLLQTLDGKMVALEGYMAPPLKPELDYFVLTRIQLQFCPFCSTAGDWPDDIALVYVQTKGVTATVQPVRVIGRLEVGQLVDQETGMVSLVRVYEQRLEILN